ncbi:Variant surface glycoprotein [Trypanosoma congolense IL3000]|uniref:Variant surface glycoprotein n=1 Tax=Trypanosoma congolense (strain IL3000) TaxID=1068625 RepID=F9WHX8_TRYCI|nr:Variant surface glycoprotein [Trypanosoma congolense IL3000]
MEKRMVKLCTMIMLAMGVVLAEKSETDHNKEDHDRLCAVLRSAVSVWGSTGSGVTEPLKTALKNTIFGYTGTEETIEKLKTTLPHDYDLVVQQPESRALWCGERRFDDAQHYGDNQVRWSGHSATHDLVCLCTAGKHGWPINGSSSEKETLCGKGKSSLKGAENKGWGITNEGKDQIDATWAVVVSECLKGAGEKEDLKKALEIFIDNLNRTMHDEYGHMYRLGEGKFNTSIFQACTGSKNLGVCAMYYPETKDAKTWWWDLKDAIAKDDGIQKKHKEDEEEKHKHKEDAEKQDSPKAEDLKSGSPNTNQTDRQQNDNITDTIRKSHMKSGTPISMPSSWFLSVVFLI